MSINYLKYIKYKTKYFNLKINNQYGSAVGESVKVLPSTIPSTIPSATPSTIPSATPSATPSTTPSATPSTTPSATPSTTPLDIPSQPDQEYYKSDLTTTEQYYYKQSIYNYWICASHNTYLPFDQIFGKCSECYYWIQMNTFLGGCVEIDTFSISDDKTDIIITHLPSNPNQIRLSSILDIIGQIVISKKSIGIITGPIILTFDNKGLKTNEAYVIFWCVVNQFKNKYPCMILDIDNNFDISAFPISTFSNNVLFRWDGKNDCEYNELRKYGKQLCEPPIFYSMVGSTGKCIFGKTGDKYYGITGNTGNSCSYQTKNESCVLGNTAESCAIYTTNVNGITGSTYTTDSNSTSANGSINNRAWVHLQKTSYASINAEIIVDIHKNASISLPIDKKLKEYKDPNIFFITNTQHTIVRRYPSWLNTSSTNYSNLEHFRNGVQMVAINFQTIDDAWYLNKAIFMQNQLVFKQGNNTNLGNPYRLKPLWLIGLIPHPGFYNLNSLIIKSLDESIKLTDYSLCHGLNIGKKNVFTNIDVSVPFFIIECTINEKIYKSGIEIPWDLSKLNGEINVDVYDISTVGLLNSFNDVGKIDSKDNNNCKKLFFFNKKDSKKVSISYAWIKSTDENTSYSTYNKAIEDLRKGDDYVRFSTKNFLEQLSLCNKYQRDLKDMIKNRLIVNNEAGFPPEYEMDNKMENKKELYHK